MNITVGKWSKSEISNLFLTKSFLAAVYYKYICFECSPEMGYIQIALMSVM